MSLEKSNYGILILKQVLQIFPLSIGMRIKFLRSNLLISHSFFYQQDKKYLIFTCSKQFKGVIVETHEQTQEKNFIPRLGAPILNLTISDDDSLYAIALVDNSIKIIKSVLSL